MRWNLMALTALLVTPVLVQAQPDVGARGPHGPGRGPDPFGRHLARYLELTPDQEQSIRRLQYDHRIGSRHQQQTIQDVHRHLQEAMDSTDPKPQALGEMLLEMRTIRDQMRHEGELLEQQIMALLDEDQRLKYEHFRELMRLRDEDIGRFGDRQRSGPGRSRSGT